jgi:hypothetical protein
MKVKPLQWITKNWQSLLLILTTIVIISYNVVATYVSSVQKLSVETKLDIILALLATYALNVAIKLNALDEFREIHLPKPRKNSSEFTNEMYKHIDSLENGMQDEAIELNNRHESMTTLLRLIDSADKTYDAMNYYLGGWKSGMKEFFEANLGAIQRGVKIRRCFILREEFRSSELATQLLDEMEKQTALGMMIFFVSEHELQRIPYYRKTPLRGTGLYDGKILSYDTSIVRHSDSPVGIRVTWNEKEVKEKNPFPHLFSSGVIKAYPKDKKELIDWLGVEPKS